MVRKAAEQAKVNIVRRYYVIGVLEHFLTTLELFETLLPHIYKGAREALQSEC